MVEGFETRRPKERTKRRLKKLAMQTTSLTKFKRTFVLFATPSVLVGYLPADRHGLCREIWSCKKHKCPLERCDNLS